MNDSHEFTSSRKSLYIDSRKHGDEVIEPEKENESYFRNDSKKEKENSLRSPRTKHEGAYDIFFKPKQFCYAFFSHIIFFFFLGPLTVFLSPLLGYQRIINYGFWGFNRSFFFQTLNYFLIIIFIVLLYTDTTPSVHYMEVYSMVFAVIIRIILISMKYGFSSESYLQAMVTRELKRDEIMVENLTGPWTLQTEEIMHHELQTSILRLEIESSLFFFEFIFKDPELEQKFNKKNSLGNIHLRSIFEDEIRNSQNFDTNSSEKVEIIKAENAKPRSRNPSFTQVQKAKSNIFVSVHQSKSRLQTWREKVFTRKRSKSSQPETSNSRRRISDVLKTTINNFSNFFFRKKLEENKLYGYNLIFDMIQRAKKMRWNSIFGVTLILSLVRAVIPILYRACTGRQVMTRKPYMVIIPLLVNFTFFYLNLNVIAVSLLDIESRTFIFQQISSLLSPRRRTHSEKKIYPTINIFDPVSLKTWENVRRISNEYGKKYIARNNANLSVLVGIYIIVIAILVLQALGVLSTYSDPLLLLIFSYESVIYFAFFLKSFLAGCFFNDQYRINKNLLKKAKIIISDFLRFSEFYVGENAIIPDNTIYKEGLKILKKELGSEEFEKKLKRRCNNLMDIIDDIMEDLDFELINEPYAILQIAADYNMLRNLAFGAASILFAIIQSFFGVK